MSVSTDDEWFFIDSNAEDLFNDGIYEEELDIEVPTSATEQSLDYTEYPSDEVVNDSLAYALLDESNYSIVDDDTMAMSITEHGVLLPPTYKLDLKSEPLFFGYTIPESLEKTRSIDAPQELKNGVLENIKIKQDAYLPSAYQDHNSTNITFKDDMFTLGYTNMNIGAVESHRIDLKIDAIPGVKLTAHIEDSNGNRLSANEIIQSTLTKNPGDPLFGDTRGGNSMSYKIATKIPGTDMKLVVTGATGDVTKLKDKNGELILKDVNKDMNKVVLKEKFSKWLDAKFVIKENPEKTGDGNVVYRAAVMAHTKIGDDMKLEGTLFGKSKNFGVDNKTIGYAKVMLSDTNHKDNEEHWKAGVVYEETGPKKDDNISFQVQYVNNSVDFNEIIEDLGGR